MRTLLLKRLVFSGIALIAVFVATLMLIISLHSLNPIRSDQRVSKSLKYKDSSSLKCCQFKILVFGWRRRASLLRLLKSLDSAEYFGYRNISLEIHLDGGAHPLVVQAAECFSWSHGSKVIYVNTDQVGLELVCPGLISFHNYYLCNLVNNGSLEAKG
jgi:hypothetical protein